MRVDDAPAALPRQLHEQRYRREILHVRACDRTALNAHVEPDAVVCHDDDERVTEEPEPAQARDQLAEEAVGQAELEEVALVGDLHEPRIAESLRPVEPRDWLGCVAPVVAAGGVELPRHVREQDVLEPERRPLARLD